MSEANPCNSSLRDDGDESYDHPFDLDGMGRDPDDDELTALSDHELAELFRDVAGGSGSVDLYDRVSYQMVRRFDEYEIAGVFDDE